ncbi:MAG: hypothetical protein FWD89_05260 [Firmicutes bacterium]|nr:hypothetical protein [Bacillota bacterium]MCL2771691.1 hypothetical protein [Bacillota bacterium]
MSASKIKKYQSAVAKMASFYIHRVDIENQLFCEFSETNVSLKNRATDFDSASRRSKRNREFAKKVNLVLKDPDAQLFTITRLKFSKLVPESASTKEFLQALFVETMQEIKRNGIDKRVEKDLKANPPLNPDGLPNYIRAMANLRIFLENGLIDVLKIDDETMEIYHNCIKFLNQEIEDEIFSADGAKAKNHTEARRKGRHNKRETLRKRRVVREREEENVRLQVKERVNKAELRRKVKAVRTNAKRLEEKTTVAKRELRGRILKRDIRRAELSGKLSPRVKADLIEYAKCPHRSFKVEKYVSRKIDGMFGKTNTELRAEKLRNLEAQRLATRENYIQRFEKINELTGPRHTRTLDPKEKDRKILEQKTPVRNRGGFVISKWDDPR